MLIVIYQIYYTTLYKWGKAESNNYYNFGQFDQYYKAYMPIDIKRFRFYIGNGAFVPY